MRFLTATLHSPFSYTPHTGEAARRRRKGCLRLLVVDIARCWLPLVYVERHAVRHVFALLRALRRRPICQVFGAAAEVAIARVRVRPIAARVRSETGGARWGGWWWAHHPPRETQETAAVRWDGLRDEAVFLRPQLLPLPEVAHATPAALGGVVDVLEVQRDVDGGVEPAIG